MKNIEGIDKNDIKWCKGFRGEYAVTKSGDVYSFKRGKPYLLDKREKKNGYLRVSIYSGRFFYRYIHRLVAEAFIGNIKDKQVDHIDGNKKNNNINNLEVVTQGENLKRQGINGLFAKGEQLSDKLKDEDVRNIKLLLRDTNLTHKEIAKRYNVHRVAIGKINSNETWRHINV